MVEWKHMDYLQYFLDNKYTKCYFRIIEKSLDRILPSISEKHHIIPKSLGGTNESFNYAKLTPREHFICHVLLTKMTTGNSKYKMLCALNLMMQKSSKNHQRYYFKPSKLYQSLREEFANYCKGRPKPEGFGKRVSLSNSTRVVSDRTKSKLKEYNETRVFTDETREKMSASAKGRVFSEEHKQKISNSLKGKVRSKEHSENISKAAKGTVMSQETKNKISEAFARKRDLKLLKPNICDQNP